MNEENPIENQTNEPEQIKKLLEQNLKLTEEIYGMTKKIKGYLAFQRLISLFYLFIIIAPIILGLIYLPPLFNSIFGQYKDVMGIQGSTSSVIQGLLNGGDNLKNSGTNQIEGLLNK